MHILILPSFYPVPEHRFGGLFFRDQALALQQAGLKVGVAYVQGRSLRRGLSINGIRDNRFQLTTAIEYNSLPTVRMHGWNTVAQTALGGYIGSLPWRLTIDRYIREYGRPDVIHAHCVEWAGYYAMQAAHRMQIPYVITEHSAAFAEGKVTPSKGRLLAQAYSNANAVVTVSHSLARSIEPWLCGCKPLIIPNVVNTDFFTPPTTRPQTTPFVFLCVARLAAIKGFDLLLQAFADRFQGDDAVRLTIVGDGPERYNLQQLACSLGIANQVRFTGAAMPDEVHQEMCRSHAFVLASHIETFAVVLIEAMATGLPVIATRCGGPEDIVTPDTGILVTVGDKAALATAMEHMRRQRIFLPTTAREHAVCNFSSTAVSAMLKQCYRNIHKI